MNKKGFMMAEVVVVSAIVLLVITGLYASYNKIYSLYNTRINYYDSTTLFRLGYYRDILIENDKIDEIINNSYNGQVIDIYNSVSTENNEFNLSENETSDYITDKVFFLNKYSFSETVLNTKGISETFKDYMKFLSTSVVFQSNHIMIMERCTIIANYGDVNCDGDVNIKDLNLLFRYLDGENILSEQGKKNADVYKDNVINIKDYNALQKHIAGDSEYKNLPIIPPGGNANTKDIDNCKYAYLEIYDGRE